jgi:hypothetical protein
LVDRGHEERKPVGRKKKHLVSGKHCIVTRDKVETSINKFFPIVIHQTNKQRVQSRDQLPAVVFILLCQFDLSGEGV